MKTAAALAVWIVAFSAEAGAQARLPDAVFSQVGTGSATEAWAIGGQWHWDRAWSVGESLVLRGRWDLAVGRWRTQLDDGDRDQTWVTQVSAVPTLRLSGVHGRGWYAEVGSGPSLLRPIFRSRDLSFSTEFNFQSHLAVGYTLGASGEHDLGLRIEHFSNAGIRSPNPGMQLASLRYTYRLGAGDQRHWLAGTSEPTDRAVK